MDNGSRTYGKEEVGYVVSDVNCQSHVGEMKPVAAPNQS
jgi:hypothetical protein